MVKLSVIIPVYNAEKYLSQTLDSVLSQSLKELEVICVDDGSTDSSLELLREYESRDSRVKVITQKNEYAGIARNKGIAAATGEYIHFLDADDYVLPYTYEAVYNKAKLHDLDLLKFRGQGYDEINGHYVFVRDYNLGHLSEDVFMRLIDLSRSDQLLWLSYTVWTGIYRTKLLKDNGIEFNHLFCVNDRSFSSWVNLLAKRAMLSRDVVVVHRMNMSESLVGKRSKYFDCLFESMDITEDILKKISADDKTYARIMNSEVEDLLHWCRRYAVETRSDNYQTIMADTEKYIREKTTGNNMVYALNKWRGIYNDALKYEGNRIEKKPSVYAFIKEEREEPLVSVIVPVNRNDDSLEETLFSLYSQNFENSEFIIEAEPQMNIALNIAEKYQVFDKRVRISDRNTAKGKYCLTVSQGDWLVKDALRLLVSKAEKENLNEVLCGYRIQYDGEEVETYSFDYPAEHAGNTYGLKAVSDGEEKGLINEPLYVKKVLKDNSKDVGSVDVLYDRNLISQSDKEYILLADRENQYMLGPVEEYLKEEPDVVILNTMNSLGKLSKDLWKKETVEYYHNKGMFKPEKSDLFELAEGGLSNKIVRKDLIENGYNAVKTLEEANRVVFTREKLCVIPLEKREANSIEQIINDLKQLNKDSYDERDYLNYCADRVLETINTDEDSFEAYSFLIGELKMNERPEYYFYNGDVAQKIKALAEGGRDFFRIQAKEYSDELTEKNIKLEDTVAALRNNSVLLQTAYKDKSDLNSTLQQTYDEKSELNAKLQQTYDEKSELNAKLQQTYAEKSELNAKLQQTYKEKSELNAKLQQTYAEKSELNAKLQQTYKEKSEINKALKETREELTNIKNSRSYKVGEALAYIPRKLKSNNK